MKRSSEFFCNADSMEWEILGGGVSRILYGWDNQIMMVKIKFEKGAIGSTHRHFHTQATYCAAGKFEFTIGDKVQIIKAGDGVYIPPDLIHGAVCLEEGILIDVFSPVREDFLDGSKPAYYGKNRDHES